MPRASAALLVLAFAAAPVAAADGIILPPLSYTKPVGGGAFTFVMFGDAAAEQAVDKPDIRDQFRRLREKYPATGLYRGDTAEPVWRLADPGFAPAPCVFLTADGEHLVRIDGDWWTDDAFVGGRRPPEDAIRAQLDGPAVSFFANGKRLRDYPVKAFVDDPDVLRTTPAHILWYANGSLNEDTGRFLMFTQDSNVVAFDYRTGAVLSKTRGGLGNPRMTAILAVCGVLSAVILGVWAYYVFVRRSPAQAEPTRAG